MAAFDVEMQFSVDPDGYTTGYGGPNVGDHMGPNWYIQYGMDLGGSTGTSVYAAFDGHVTKFKRHIPAQVPPVAGQDHMASTAPKSS
jgi:murein DD-endopeptidase MepM/ murein hydrolase activator NlpD